MVPHPVVSAVIPLYGGEHYVSYLPASIESCLSQSFQDFELLIVTDPTTSPEIMAIVDDYSDQRIRNIQLPTHLGGYVRMLNIGFASAKGRYVARFDADDVNLPARFQKQVEFLDLHPEFGVVGSAYDIIDGQDRVIKKPVPTIGQGLIKWKLLFCDNPIAHPSVMVRKEIFDRLGGYNPDVLYCEDYELWIRTLEVTQLANLPDRLLRLRKHRTSISHRHQEAQLNNALPICHRALSLEFKRSVPSRYVDAIVMHRVRNSVEAFEAASWMFDRCLEYLAKTHLAPMEKTAIKVFTASKLYPLALICAKRSPLHSARVWKLILSLAPGHSTRLLCDSLERIAKYPLRRMRRIFTFEHRS